MLKSELIRARVATQGDQVWTRPLQADYHYLTVANELVALFKEHVGRSRGELYAALRDYEGDSLDYPVSGLGQGFDAANATAALRLSSQGDIVSVGVVTSVNLNGQVKLWQAGQVVAMWPVAVGPGRTFNVTQPGMSGVLGLQLLDSAGRLIAQAGSVP